MTKASLVQFFVATNHASLSLLWQILLDSAECIKKSIYFLKKYIEEQILSNTEFHYTVKLRQSK